MSTISTDEQDMRFQFVKERLQDLQRKIVQAGADIEDLSTQLQALHKQNPQTQKEFSERQNLIAFKERHIDEINKTVKRLRIKAAYFAQILENAS